MGTKEKLRERFKKTPSDFTFDEMQRLLEGYGYEKSNKRSRFNQIKGGKNMNTMTYKGYLGSVAYSEKDQVFFGKVEGINGLVNFEGESVKELTEAFHEAVDDYLAYCEDEGIEPDKSYTGVLNVRLTPSIHRQIAMLARQAGLTINAYIKDTLENKIKTAAVL